MHYTLFAQDEQTDEPQLTYDNQEQTTQINCDGTYRKAVDGECIGTCGIGERNRTRISKYPDQCEPLIETNPCNLKPCKNEGNHALHQHYHIEINI